MFNTAVKLPPHIPIYGYTERDLLEYMHLVGKARFGSECKHRHVLKGRCANCQRKVIT